MIDNQTQPVVRGKKDTDPSVWLDRVSAVFRSILAILRLFTKFHFTIHVYIKLSALSRISPRIRVRVSVSIVLGLASGGYSWI